MSPHRQEKANEARFMFNCNMELHAKNHLLSKATTSHRAVDPSAFVDDHFTYCTKSHHCFTQLFLPLAPLHCSRAAYLPRQKSVK